MTARPGAAKGSKPLNQANTQATAETRTAGPKTHKAHIGATTAAVTSMAIGLSSMANFYLMTRDGKPTLVVAIVKAATLVLLSSKVTTAVFFLKETVTLPTPGTRASVCFTMYGQDTQVIPSTAKVTDRRAAWAWPLIKIATATAAAPKDFFISVGLLANSYIKNKRGGIRKRHCR